MDPSKLIFNIKEKNIYCDKYLFKNNIIKELLLNNFEKKTDK
jgi:hypothetical protein